MKLTEENYFSSDANMFYTGSTQIKDFLKCEECALAKLKGNWESLPTKSMQVSSYIDASISGTLKEFKEKNSNIFLKSGDLKSDYKIAEDVVNQIKDDPMFYKYVSGEPQKIFTGEISNVPVKIKIDSYHEGKCIVDLKAIANFDLIWNERAHKKENFINYYDYVLQGALYQEIVRQNTGLKLPFIIAATTKQKYAKRALLQIPQDELDLKLVFLKSYLPRVQALKQGVQIPTNCNECEYCVSKLKTKKIFYYDDFFS